MPGGRIDLSSLKEWLALQIADIVSRIDKLQRDVSQLKTQGIVVSDTSITPVRKPAVFEPPTRYVDPTKGMDIKIKGDVGKKEQLDTDIDDTVRKLKGMV